MLTKAWFLARLGSKRILESRVPKRWAKKLWAMLDMLMTSNCDFLQENWTWVPFYFYFRNLKILNTQVFVDRSKFFNPYGFLLFIPVWAVLSRSHKQQNTESSLTKVFALRWHKLNPKAASTGSLRLCTDPGMTLTHLVRGEFTLWLWETVLRCRTITILQTQAVPSFQIRLRTYTVGWHKRHW